MPQMSPISWIFMFFTVYALFIVYNVMNYYSSVTFPNKEATSPSCPQASMYWKW